MGGKGFCDYALVYFCKFPPRSDLLIFILGSKAQALFIITLKKRDLKESNRSGTSAENVAKAQKAFTQYEFIHWLDDFLAIRQGKNNLPVRDQFKEDEDKQSLHDEGNLVMPPDITPISELIEEDIEDTEQGFTFNTQKVRELKGKE